MFLFPAIDLRDGRVVRLRQGDYGQQTTYGDDPLEQARTFERAGATWLHVVDLDGARSGKMAHLDVVRSICTKTNLKVETGGGVRDATAVERLIAAGADRVVLGTAALKDMAWFEGLVKAHPQRLVLGLDARGGMAAVSGWETQTDTAAIEVAHSVSDWQLAAIVYTDIATDGTMQGPNVKSTRQIATKTQVPVVASGGVATLEDLRTLRELPIQGAIVGRALYENAFTIEDALEVFERGR